MPLPTIDDARMALARIAAVRRPAVEANDERRRAAEDIRRREAACEACDGALGSSVCALKTCRPCRRSALIRRPNMSCLRTPPIWGPGIRPKEA